MHSARSIADRFGDLDFHDDTFVSMSILPSQTRNDGFGSVIEIQLCKHSENTNRLIRFVGCSNLRVAFDFDVLVNNLPPNTAQVEADIDHGRIEQLMRSQKADWGVKYSQKTRTPLERKLECVGELVIFRVQFFGGIVEIIARDFCVTNATGGVL